MPTETITLSDGQALRFTTDHDTPERDNWQLQEKKTDWSYDRESRSRRTVTIAPARGVSFRVHGLCFIDRERLLAHLDSLKWDERNGALVQVIDRVNGQVIRRRHGFWF